MNTPIFHIAVAVDDLNAARPFYVDTLGCRERADTSDRGFSVLNFFGAQLVLTEPADHTSTERVNQGVAPARHFGIIMDWDDWHEFRAGLRSKNVAFHIEPSIKDHPGIGKVGTLFVSDPSGNFLEFKSYQDPTRIY